ncbi:MAG: hypothetical protein FWF79_01875 [Defluviitaleaceae bacterium]|nr:hypothetical protein [Defluviitaleaceae bacterium]
MYQRIFLLQNFSGFSCQMLKKLSLAILKIAQCVYPKRASIKGIRHLLTMKLEQEIGKIFSLLNSDNLENINM